LAVRRTLEETVALLEATLEATQDGILVLDLDRRVILYNQRLLSMLGLRAGDVEEDPGAALEKVVAELEDPEAFRARSRELWGDPSRPAADELRFRDGRVIARYVAPHRVGSKIVGVVASFRDVSQSLRTEQALERYQAFLEKAQEVAHVGSWIADMDSDDRLGWSTETHRIFGVTIGEFAGTSASFLAFVHPDDRETVRNLRLATRRTSEPYEVEHRIVRADGTVRWVRERAEVLRDAQGRAARLIGTVQDVTDQRQLEEQLRQAQKMEAMGRLAGGIAHDLNNALTAIAGYTELALGELAEGHPSRADVGEIRRAAERAASVTGQLLAFSRKQLLERRVFDLNDTVTNLGRLLGRLLGDDIDLRTSVHAAPAPIFADPGQIEQAIINLAVNARDAMPEGGRLTIATSLFVADEVFARAHAPMAPGRYTVLSVTDTGQGMDPETQAHIFEPFFTTKEVGKGTGLGLSMVYGTVKQTGGFIFVESEAGRGASFHMYFPPATLARSTARSTAAPVERARRVSSGPETLLVVEDEPSVRSLVTASLAADGYRILQAGSADEAVRVAAGHPSIDLLLTDANMPGRSGIDLAGQLVAERPGLRVVIMSGYTTESLAVEGLRGSVCLLQKPFTPKELRRTIHDALARAAHLESGRES